jgi:hypothetical protein
VSVGKVRIVFASNPAYRLASNQPNAIHEETPLIRAVGSIPPVTLSAVTSKEPNRLVALNVEMAVRTTRARRGAASVESRPGFLQPPHLRKT